jgi:hypothetical protein
MRVKGVWGDVDSKLGRREKLREEDDSAEVGRWEVQMVNDDDDDEDEDEEEDGDEDEDDDE